MTTETPWQCQRGRSGDGLMDGSGWRHKNLDPRIPDPHHTARAKPEWECYGCGEEVWFVGRAVSA